MTEWEQIKNEYKEIPVPANGPHQMMETMAKARKARSRNRWKRVAAYGTVAAAALLVILIVPGRLLFSGGLGATCNDTAASMEADCALKSTASDGAFYRNGASTECAPESNMAPASSDTTASAESNTRDECGVATEAPSYSMSGSTGSSPNSSTGSNPNNSAGSNSSSTGSGATQEAATDNLMAAQVWDAEAISKEILRQMEERMQETGETYYKKSEEYPEGFEQIAEDQEYYINEEGLLVIVFEAGTVAPEELGVVEFVIPAGVAAP